MLMITIRHDTIKFIVQGKPTPQIQTLSCKIYNITFNVLYLLFSFQTMTEVVGNPEEERRSEFYYQPWAQEAVCRYFYTKVQQKRAELEQALGIRNT